MEGLHFAAVLLLTLCSQRVDATSNRSEICQLQPDTGDCKIFTDKYYFDPSTKTCKRFSYGGCGGNGNKFKTQMGCKRFCSEKTIAQKVCELPVESGTCVSFRPRFYYDSSTGTCQSFTYSGCGGNRNNFPSQQACLNACQQPESSTSDGN